MSAVVRMGEVDEVLVMLGAIAMQPTASGTTLVQQQLALMAAATAPGQRVFTMMSPGDGHGFGSVPLLTVDLAEHTTAGAVMSSGWMDTGFKKLWIDSRIQVTGPFPSLQLIARPGAMQMGPTGPREEDYVAFVYNIDAIALATGDVGILTQRKAMLDILAFWRAVRLDDTLGGLVQHCRPRLPVEPGGGGGAGDRGSTVMAARVSFEVYSLVPD